MLKGMLIQAGVFDEPVATAGNALNVTFTLARGLVQPFTLTPSAEYVYTPGVNSVTGKGLPEPMNVIPRYQLNETAPAKFADKETVEPAHAVIGVAFTVGKPSGGG
jgi:hypothetical protein